MFRNSIGYDVAKIKSAFLSGDYMRPADAGFVSGFEWSRGYFKRCCSRYLRICFLMALVERRAENASEVRKRRLRRFWKCLRSAAVQQLHYN